MHQFEKKKYHLEFFVQLRTKREIVDKDDICCMDRFPEIGLKKVALDNLVLPDQILTRHDNEPFPLTFQTSSSSNQNKKTCAGDKEINGVGTCAYSAGMSCFSIPKLSSHNASAAT